MTVDNPEALPSEASTPANRVPLIAALLASVVLLGVAGASSVLAWPVALLGMGALATASFEYARLPALGGGGLFAVLVVAVWLGGVGDAPDAGPQLQQVRTAEQAPTEGVAGSLGIYLDDIPELWNALERPPGMVRGLITETETGPYDSFRHRFGPTAVLAGAFDPANDSVHALYASIDVSDENAASFYLHLCFMVHPYSPECIDAYFEEGLGGKTLDDYQTHQTQWTLGEELWKLDIADGILTLRVLGPEVR